MWRVALVTGHPGRRAEKETTWVHVDVARRVRLRLERLQLRCNRGCVCASTMGLRELGERRIADFQGATRIMVEWQREEDAQTILVLLDQSTIVKNARVLTVGCAG